MWWQGHATFCVFSKPLITPIYIGWKPSRDTNKFLTLRNSSVMSSYSCESLNHRDPPCFFSLNTSLNIKTVISKVSIPVLISRLKIWESPFQSQYKNSNFKSLDSSLDIKTQLSKVAIPVSMSRLDSRIFNLCPNLEACPAAQIIIDNANPPMCKILLFSKKTVTFEMMMQFDAQ